MQRALHGVVFFVGLACPAARAQTGPGPAPSPTPTPSATPAPGPPAPAAPTPVTPAFRLPVRALTLSAEVRHRYEAARDFDFNAAAADADDLVGQRIRLGVEVTAGESLKGFLQVQDARAWGNASVSPINGLLPPTAGSGNNTVAAQGASTDLHQAYFWAGDKRSGLSLQVGRQEWLYANQKVVGPLGWSHIGRAFDGVRLRHDKPRDTIDVLWSRISEGGRTRAGTPVIDRVDADFYGVYGTFRLVRTHPFDLYWLALRDDEAVAGEKGITGSTRFHTLGFQLSKVQPAGALSFEYGTELNYQFGRRSGMDHEAHALHGRFGVGSTRWPLQAKLIYHFDLATGDGARADGRSETFQQLFPTAHLYQGYIDLVARQNVRDHWVALHTVPAKDWRAGFHFHALAADKGTDALYRKNGAVIRIPAAGASGGTDFGREVDVIVDRKMSANWLLQAGFSRFLTGSYLRRVPPAGASGEGPHDDVSFFYLMSTVGF